MSIIGGLDVHRAQITFDWVDRDSGETHRGRSAPATRATLRGWLSELPRAEGAFAVEGCTGWRFVSRSCRRPGSSRIWLSRPRPAACAAQAAGQDRPG